MRNEWRSTCAGMVISALLASVAAASQDSIGPNGINSAGLHDFKGNLLDGTGVDIGQVEPGRPGKDPPDDPATKSDCCNTDVWHSASRAVLGSAVVRRRK